MRKAVGVLVVTLAMLPLVVGCTMAPASDAAPEPLPAPVSNAPLDELTRLSGEDADTGLAASELVFSSSPVVVLADDDTVLTGASVAVALGVPLLSAAIPAAAIIAELDRLGAEHLLLVGDAPAEAVLDDRTVHRVGSSTALLTEQLGIAFRETVSAGTGAATVAALDPAAPQHLVIEPADAGATPAPSGGGVGAEPLPAMTRAKALEGVLVLTVDGMHELASLATLRAAGAEVHVLPEGVTNPQQSSAAIEALAARSDARTVVLGAAFDHEASLDWKLRSARTGRQLPAGGQLLFPAHQLVALYGTPGAPVLGVLGEQGLPESIQRARQHADPYVALSDRTVLPAFEIIATIASAGAGADGNYSNELPADELLHWAQAAQDAGMYVILDLQPGHTDFVTQARQYEAVLRLPWVGLALDPEWRLAPGQRHLVHIGSVHSSEVNAVQDYLTELAHAHDLPPKLLVLHQFRSSMIADRTAVEVNRPEVTVLIHVDGQGTQPQKQATWRTLHADAPVTWWGWKNFYDEDSPMLTPEQTATVVPVPDLITYQ